MATASAAPPAKEGVFGTTVVIALVLVLAWQLAYWTWAFVAPLSATSAAPAPTAVDLAAIARLFGASAPSGAGNTSVDGWSLKGVVAPTPGVAASAIFAPRAGKDISVFIGAEVSPGVKLVEVDPDHVIVSRGAVRERIDLEAPHSTGTPQVAARARGFRLNVSRSGTNQYALSRHELDEALRDPGQLEYLGQIGMPRGGGVRMDAAPAGSLAAKLGLQPGDVISKVNGQAVTSTGDLARLYQQFATISQIQAEIRRGNATVQLTYQIQ
jgi:general secretion pathway protein C